MRSGLVTAGSGPQTAGVEFQMMMALEPHGPDAFVGVGPGYPWGGLYGGQIVAQALRAAAATVDEGFRPHSLHAFFIRRGDQDEPIRFEVDRLRNGRSFATRAVIARQTTGAILHMSASFQVDEPDAADVQAASAPDLARPESLEETSWSPMFGRRYPMIRANGRSAGWLRMLTDIGDDPVMQACALAYTSDDLAMEAAMALHPDFTGDWSGEKWVSASLDHAIWFHRPARADAWMLQDFRCDGLRNSRGLTIGQVFDEGGIHVATVAQEVLLRPRRERS
ncbi:MAG: acyl-CoA thioesterase II [Acidimicrobiales bacterium]